MVAQQGTGQRLSLAITIGLGGYLQNASYRLKTHGNFLLPYICVQGHILYIPTVVHLRTPVRLCSQHLLSHFQHARLDFHLEDVITSNGSNDTVT
jgi:hypothetical protein